MHRDTKVALNLNDITQHASPKMLGNTLMKHNFDLSLLHTLANNVGAYPPDHEYTQNCDVKPKRYTHDN